MNVVWQFSFILCYYRKSKRKWWKIWERFSLLLHDFSIIFSRLTFSLVCACIYADIRLIRMCGACEYGKINSVLSLKTPLVHSLSLSLSTCERASFSYSWFIIIYRLDFSSSSFILISHHWVILGFSLHEIYFRDFFNRQRMIMIAREVNYRIKKLF